MCGLAPPHERCAEEKSPSSAAAGYTGNPEPLDCSAAAGCPKASAEIQGPETNPKHVGEP